MAVEKVNEPLSDEDILAEVRYQATRSAGSEYAADELTTDRSNAMKYYLGKPRGDEKPDGSLTISMDVADMVDSILSQVMPTFTQDQIVQFEATSEQDEEQARIESNICNYIVMEKNNGYVLLETVIKDALLSKNGTVKVMIDVDENKEEEKYKGLSKEEMLMVLIPQSPNEDVDVKRMDEEKGDIRLIRTKTKRHLRVLPVAPENFSITTEQRTPFLEDCNYCNERTFPTRSDLIEQGYDADSVMSLPAITVDTKVDSIERNQINDEQNYFNTSPSMQNLEMFTHYIRIDKDGDGVAELYKVDTVENNLIYYPDGSSSVRKVECIPYANGVAILMGHRFYGLSIYDKLRHVQDTKTSFLRQWEDNALINNHNKTDVVEDRVNMDDFTNGRAVAVRRVESIDSVREVPIHDIGPSCQLGLDYQDKIRTDRTGSALDLQANQMNMPSNVGDQGVNTLVANLEQVSALMTRNLSETLIKNMYLLVHKYLRLYFPEEINARVGSQWVASNPSQWLEREQVNVSIPPTRSEKIVQQVALEKMILHSSNDLAQGKGGITTDEGQIYQMRLDHARLSGIDNPDKYLTNPDSPQAQQVAQQRAMQEQQMAMEQQAKQDQLNSQLIQTQIMEIRRNWESDIADREQKTVQFMEDLEFKYTELFRKLQMDKYETDVQADTDEAKIVGDATTKIAVEDLKRSGGEDEAEVRMTQ